MRQRALLEGFLEGFSIETTLEKVLCVSTGVWCVPGFDAGFEIAFEPSKLRRENAGKGHTHFLRQSLVCTKPCFKGGRVLRRVLRRGSKKKNQ